VNTIINNAELSDLDEIYEIEVSSFDSPYPVELLKALLILFKEYFLVAKAEKTLLGYAVGTLRNDVRSHIVSIAIRKDFRRRGVGRMLMAELERRFKRAGANYSYLEVEVTNVDALRFYVNIGYRISKLHLNYYGKGRHAFIMVKSLRGGPGFE
jgi:ribosomal-protein-alanine N-acetyltransferase